MGKKKLSSSESPAAPRSETPSVPLLFWDFQNVLSERGVSLSVGASLHPREVSGLAAQTGGGPAERWGETGMVFLTRFLGTNEVFLWVTTTQPLFLEGLTFRHWHNHNPGFPTAGGYQVQLQIDSGDGSQEVGKPLRLNNRNSGSIDTMRIDEVLAPGGHRISWHPRKLRFGTDTNTEFFALKDLHLTGRLLEAGSTESLRPTKRKKARIEAPISAQPDAGANLGLVTAEIENNNLVRYVVTGPFRGKPVHKGEYDWEYNSWRLTGPGSRVTFRFDRPDDVEKLAVGVVWAGWGEQTRIALFVNNKALVEDHAVHGSAWGNPMRETFPIPPEILHARNTITLELREDSPMVLFFKEISLKQQEG